MENTTINTTTVIATEATPVNYIGNYYKKGEHDFENFFIVNKVEGDKIDEYEKKLKELTAQIDETETKLASEYSKKYSQKYYKPEKSVYLYYVDRNNVKHYYALNGQGVDESHVGNSYLYPLDVKSGEIDVLAGYCYDLASIVIKTYKYSIASDNNTIKLKVIMETLYDFLSGQKIDNRGLAMVDARYSSFLRDIEGDEFISKLYGVNANLGLKLRDYYDKKERNASFETILKTAPKEVMKQLLNLDCKEPMANYKLMGITKETYNDAIARGIISEVFALKDYIQKQDVFNKTEAEWLDMIEASKAYQEDLKFYDIDVSNHHYWNAYSVPENCRALYSLAELYDDNRCIRDYYSFGKYVNYVVDSCINQGYSSISNFVGELRDYCSMCKSNHAKPILYSNSLKITHDVMSRNLRVVVSAEDENTFKSRYTDFKPYKKEFFSIIAPSCTEDVKTEGNQMNSCIGGYIKKVIDGLCTVLFLRKTDDLNNSLVSLEIKDGALIQAKQCHNDDITDEQEEFLKKFCEDRKLTYAI